MTDHRPTNDPPPAIPGNFPAIVRWVRDREGLTQQDFAALFEGVLGQPQLAKWEQGRLASLPRPEALLRFAALSGYAPGALLDALGYWGSAGPDDGMAPARHDLRELLAAAEALPPEKVRTLTAVARQMGEPQRERP